MFKISKSAVAAVTLFAMAANAHLAAFHEAMYCLNGNTGNVDLNSYDIVSPLYQLQFKDWWFHAVNGCDQFPPAPGKYIDLPAGGSFMVEIASNRAKTTLSYGGRDTSDWPDGGTYPEDYNVPTCIISPNMHTPFHAKAAGTAFAISYTSDIKQVTPENLVVFSVRYNTPWKRVTWYDVPKAMPPCPPGGCICAWGWVPDGCGQPNMYHQAFKCNVSGSTSNTPLAAPKPPVWCENNPSACTKGAKQMIYWNQLERNNIQVDGFDAAGDHKSPAYNMKLGFVDGAQNDIFAGAPSGTGSNPSPPATSPSSTAGSGSNAGSSSQGATKPATPTGTSVGSGSGSTNSPGAGSPGTPAGGSTTPTTNAGSTPTGSSPTSAAAVVTPTRLACKRNPNRKRQTEAPGKNSIMKRVFGGHNHAKKRTTF